MYRIDVAGEDEIPCVVGSCKCDRGENSLIIYAQKAHPNPTERANKNNIVFLQCIACKTKSISNTKDLTKGNAP
jgi:hypothetical protein